ncbi:acetyltransferase [Alicyclobacillus sp. ALC3]|uniref:acetyltransferase n=1 Tax=Alicyclobacillus sp. ALC3 TaxID=2796143 RepID=UPI002378994A|nr:acetyltransferase [Alicyclobacillus sp. ALC3]WDL95151.1 acetyltransferase [Alicyclobacillus sp. ALC3]
MPERVIILGAGGHAKVIAETLRMNPDYEILGCLSEKGIYYIGGRLRVIGDDTLLPTLYKDGVRQVVIGIGDNRVRHERANAVRHLGFSLLNVIHPTAYVSESVTLGSGVVIMANTVVNTDTRIDDNTIINTGTTVDHDCVIEDSCHIAPGCTLSGGVRVGAGTWLGTGTSVIDHISIGAWSVIGAGAVVVTDLPSDCIAYGVPARVQRSLK